MNYLRCNICGKFIKNEDMNTDKTKVIFIPDTDFTKEETEIYHIECFNKIWLSKKT